MTKKKTELEYALDYVDLLIKENHRLSIAEILMFWWANKPNHRRLHLLNLKTLNTVELWKKNFNKIKPLLNEVKTKPKGKNDKTNIVKFRNNPSIN